MSSSQVTETIATNRLVRKHTAARTMEELVNLAGYTPALRGPKLATLADAYDDAQRAKGDTRRAAR